MSGVIRENAYSTIDSHVLIPDNGLTAQIIGMTASWEAKSIALGLFGAVGATKIAVCCNAASASPSVSTREPYTQANQTKDCAPGLPCFECKSLYGNGKKERSMYISVSERRYSVTFIKQR